MKISNSRKIIATLWMSLAWVSSTNTHAEDIVWKQVEFQNKEQPAQTGFPEKLKTFLEMPGKRDVIEVPMQETYYIQSFVSNLASNEDTGKRMRDSFVEVTPAQLGVVTAKMKTSGRSLNMYIRDMDTGYYYAYDFGNGYLVSTTLSIPINDRSGDEKLLTNNKIDYLQKRFDSYLISQGYKNTTSFLGNFFNGISTYEKGNILVDINDYGLLDKTFTVTATKKEIRENLKEIRSNLTANNIKLEYKNLDKMLDGK